MIKNWRKIEQKITEGIPSAKGNCYFCRKEVNGWVYCFGCKEFICNDCNKNPEACGKHDVSEHKKS